MRSKGITADFVYQSKTYTVYKSVFCGVCVVYVCVRSDRRYKNVRARTLSLLFFFICGERTREMRHTHTQTHRHTHRASNTNKQKYPCVYIYRDYSLTVYIAIHSVYMCVVPPAPAFPRAACRAT